MFKKYRVESRLVKDEQKTEAPRITPNDFVPLVQETVKGVVAGALVLVPTYVAVDTARRVIVHIAATKIS